MMLPRRPWSMNARSRRAAEERRRDHVDVHHLVERLGGDLEELAGRRDARVVDDDVEPPEVLARDRRQSPDPVAVAHVTCLRDDPVRMGGGEPGERIGRAGDREHADPLPHERERGVLPQPAARAGDDRDVPIELQVHVSISVQRRRAIPSRSTSVAPS